MEEMTIQEVVFMKIIDLYPTEKVEQNLSLESTLKEELGLNDEEIHHLGLSIEQHYDKDLDYHFSVPDESIISWVTVQDIISTLESLLK